MSTSRHREHVLAGAACTAFAALAGALTAIFPYASAHGDFADAIARAQALSSSDISVWANGLYPLGYHGLLRLLHEGIGHYMAAGQVIAVASGALLIYASFWLARALTGSVGTALWTVAFMSTNFIVLNLSIAPMTDMSAAALQVAGFAVLLGARQGSRYEQAEVPGNGLPWSRACVAGLLLGLSYLFRYQAILALFPALLWLVARPQRRWRGMLACGAGFLLASSPQLVLSTLVHRSSFYNTQATNLWLALDSGLDFGASRCVPQHVTLLAVARMAPLKLMVHWLDGWSMALRLELVSFPLGLLAYGGLMWCAFAKTSGIPRAKTALAALAMLSLFSGVALFCASERFLLPLVPLLTVFAIQMPMSLIPVRCAFGRWGVPTRVLALAALLLAAAWQTLLSREIEERIVAPGARHAASISAALREAGMHSPKEVLCTDRGLVDAGSPTLERYASFDDVVGTTEDASRLARLMASTGHRFILFDEPGRQRHQHILRLLDRADRSPHFRLVYHEAALPRWTAYRLADQ